MVCKGGRLTGGGNAVPDKESTAWDILLESGAELLEVSLEQITIIGRSGGVVTGIQVALIIGKGIIAHRAAEKDFHSGALLVKGRQGVQDDIIGLPLVFPNALGRFPDVLCYVLPIFIEEKGGIHEAGDILCFREKVDDGVGVQGSCKTAGAEAGNHQRIRITQIRAYHRKYLIPVGIAPMMNDVLFPVKSGIREITGSGMEITGGIGDDHISPVLERIILNGSPESHGG